MTIFINQFIDDLKKNLDKDSRSSRSTDPPEWIHCFIFQISCKIKRISQSPYRASVKDQFEKKKGCESRNLWSDILLWLDEDTDWSLIRTLVLAESLPRNLRTYHIKDLVGRYKRDQRYLHFWLHLTEDRECLNTFMDQMEDGWIDILTYERWRDI